LPEGEEEAGGEDTGGGEEAAAERREKKVLDPVMLEAIETEAHVLAKTIAALLSDTQDSLGTASAISAQCAVAYNDSTEQMGQAVDTACASMEAMLGECGKLEGTFEDMDRTAERLKQLRQEVDMLDGMMKRSTKLKSPR